MCRSINNNKQMIFQEVAGMWQRVDSQEPHPQTLAEVLEQLNIVIDDRTQFARLNDYNENICIIYRVYGGKITIQICVKTKD